MLIEVTQEDIDKGQPRKACLCPVALAIKRQTGFDYIRVGGDSISMGHTSLDCTPYITPIEVERFIYDFDRFGDSSKGPFSFDLTELFTEEEW